MSPVRLYASDPAQGIRSVSVPPVQRSNRSPRGSISRKHKRYSKIGGRHGSTKVDDKFESPTVQANRARKQQKQFMQGVGALAGVPKLQDPPVLLTLKNPYSASHVTGIDYCNSPFYTPLVPTKAKKSLIPPIGLYKGPGLEFGELGSGHLSPRAVCHPISGRLRKDDPKVSNRDVFSVLQKNRNSRERFRKIGSRDGVEEESSDEDLDYNGVDIDRALLPELQKKLVSPSGILEGIPHAETVVNFPNYYTLNGHMVDYDKNRAKNPALIKPVGQALENMVPKKFDTRSVSVGPTIPHVGYAIDHKTTLEVMLKREKYLEKYFTNTGTALGPEWAEWADKDKGSRSLSPGMVAANLNLSGENIRGGDVYITDLRHVKDITEFRKSNKKDAKEEKKNWKSGLMAAAYNGVGMKEDGSGLADNKLKKWKNNNDNSQDGKIPLFTPGNRRRRDNEKGDDPLDGCNPVRAVAEALDLHHKGIDPKKAKKDYANWQKENYDKNDGRRMSGVSTNEGDESSSSGSGSSSSSSSWSQSDISSSDASDAIDPTQFRFGDIQLLFSKFQKHFDLVGHARGLSDIAHAGPLSGINTPQQPGSSGAISQLGGTSPTSLLPSPGAGQPKTEAQEKLIKEKFAKGNPYTPGEISLKHNMLENMSNLKIMDPKEKMEERRQWFIRKAEELKEHKARLERTTMEAKNHREFHTTGCVAGIDQALFGKYPDFSFPWSTEDNFKVDPVPCLAHSRHWGVELHQNEFANATAGTQNEISQASGESILVHHLSKPNFKHAEGNAAGHEGAPDSSDVGGHHHHNAHKLSVHNDSSHNYVNPNQHGQAHRNQGMRGAHWLENHGLSEEEVDLNKHESHFIKKELEKHKDLAKNLGYDSHEDLQEPDWKPFRPHGIRVFNRNVG